MDKKFHQLIRNREELSVRYDPETKAIWVYSNPNDRPCYSLGLVTEYRQLQWDVIEYYNTTAPDERTPIHYFINASQTMNIYNYGGDLNLFTQAIQEQNRDALYEYAKVCVDLVYLNAVNLNLPITTISLVEGTALGGGFEGVISCNVSIVEEQCEMGLPEIRFNLIPGMGAYSFLARLVGIKVTEEIISSGKVYDARTLYEMGVITQVVKQGEGEAAVNKFMKRNSRLFNGMQALQEARRRYQPIDYDELIDITKIWVDAALRLTPNDLKMMHKLVDAQNAKNIKTEHKLRTKQDRRFESEEVNFPFIDIDGNVVEKDRRVRPDPR